MVTMILWQGGNAAAYADQVWLLNLGKISRVHGLVLVLEAVEEAKGLDSFEFQRRFEKAKENLGKDDSAFLCLTPIYNIFKLKGRVKAVPITFIIGSNVEMHYKG